MRPIFFNRQDILRSGWRAAIFILCFTFATAVLSTSTRAVLNTMGVETLAGTQVYLILGAVSSLVSALIAGWICARYLEGLPFRSLGLAFSVNWHTHLALGIVVGGLTLCTTLLLLLLVGSLSFASNHTSTPNEIIQSLATSLVVFSVAAAFEEVLFRGYLLQTFARSGLAWFAIAATAVIFGAVHSGNPNADLISTANTVLAGFWFGYAYLKTRDLWFVWGVHLMWNWMQGSIFGIEVSGLTAVTEHPILREIDHGPNWLTGGEYGVEAGVACTAAIIMSIILIRFIPWLKPDVEMSRLTGQPHAEPGNT